MKELRCELCGEKLDADGIRQGLRMAYRLRRPLKKKEIFDLAGESLSGAAGRATYFGLI